MFVRAADQNIKLRVGYDSQPPFRFTNQQGEAEGIDIDRVSAILDQAGIEYEFEEYPWKRLLRLIQRGRLDVGMAAAKLEKRQVYAWFSKQPFSYGVNVLMVKPEVAASFKNILSLDAIKEMDVKIGMRRGASYSDEYEALLFDPVFASKLVTLSNARQAIQLTNAGRIAGFIGNPQIIKFEAMKACIESEYEQVYDLLANENSETYLIYSKKTVDVPLVTRIDSAMREVDSASDKFNENYIPPSFSCD